MGMRLRAYNATSPGSTSRVHTQKETDVQKVVQQSHTVAGLLAPPSSSLHACPASFFVELPFNHAPPHVCLISSTGLQCSIAKFKIYIHTTEVGTWLKKQKGSLSRSGKNSSCNPTHLIDLGKQQEQIYTCLTQEQLCSFDFYEERMVCLGSHCEIGMFLQSCMSVMTESDMMSSISQICH